MFMEPEGNPRDVGLENLVNLIFLVVSPGAVEFVANSGKIRKNRGEERVALSKL